MWLTHAKLQASLTYKRLIICVVVTTLLMLALMCLPLGVKLGLMFVTLVYGVMIYMRQGGMRADSAIIAMSRIDTREWRLTSKHGESWVGYLAGDSLLTSRLIVLRFKLRNRWQPLSLVLFQDTVGQDEFRRLLITLKLDR